MEKGSSGIPTFEPYETRSVFVCRGVLSASLNYNAHVKFVIKELEKIRAATAVAPDEAAHGAASSAERDELGRAANAVCA